MNSEHAGTFLTPYRVLDLSNENGYLCGRVLGDLGADVIKVERPGGDHGRSLGPFYHDMLHPEKSLFWFAYNSNKRSITLNVETMDGREIFKRLAQKADFVIETYAPGYLDKIGLGYAALKKINPNLILVSITPFGQTGPYRDYKGGDLIGMATGGQMYLVGDPDRAPLRISFFQAALHACGQAVIGSLLALLERRSSGTGQHVDVSIQQCVTWTTQGNPTSKWILQKTLMRRAGNVQMALTSGRGMRIIWPCKDGFIAFRLLGGSFGAKTNLTLVSWMREEGLYEEVLSCLTAEDFDMGRLDDQAADRIEGVICSFFLKHTRAELYQEGIRRRMVIYPVNTPKSIVDDPQLQSRGFWAQVEHPELGLRVSYPGAFAKTNLAPIKIRRRAPLIGEHNEEIYSGELGYSRQELLALKESSTI